MKILHVASFVGNVGDNASHMGLKNILDQFFGAYVIERKEMRRFYKNYAKKDLQKFDEKFINYANTFDLLIIGGGGFLDYWVKDSVTGTTIDMHPDLVKTIKVPTLIMSVGCMPHRVVPQGNIEKFKAFLKAVFNNSKVAIVVRNDGSIETLRQILGEDDLVRIPEVLDNGFYYDIGTNECLPVDNYVAINITLDQIRMNSISRGDIDICVYEKEICKVIKFIITDLGKNIVFVPHIYSDLRAIYQVLEGFDDFLIRTKISIAPYVQGNEGANLVFGIYKKSLLVLATRYHANVCSISMGIPVIGLAALSRVNYLYKFFNRENDCIDISCLFSESLMSKMKEKLFDQAVISNREYMDNQIKHSLSVLRNVLSRIGVSQV